MDHILRRVREHWEIHDMLGKCVVSGDTEKEAIDAFVEHALDHLYRT
jgi:hypothetical protein